MTNKEIVLEAYNALINDRDAGAVDRYWGPAYIQHNAQSPDGVETLRGLLGMLGPDTRWELGLAVSEGDLVMVQSRTTGLGPKPFIRVDIVRLENGRIVEHWDVGQEEAETASGNPMFTPR